MSYKYKTIFSLLVYILSIGLLTLADFIVVSSFSQENIAEWAFYKSLIFIFGGMCVLGFDQLLLREVEQYLNFKKQFLIQSLFISFLVSLGLYFYLESYIKSLLCFFIMFFYSFSLFEAGYWRGKKELLISQLNTNLWKICIFIVLSIFIFFNLSKNILQHYFLAFFISFLILILINNFCRGKNDIIKSNNKGDKIKYFFLGVYFFLHSFSLVIANYGEQFLINIFHNKELSKLIFSYITIYSSLVLAGIGFVGFYLGPRIRYKEKFNLKIYKKYQIIVAIFGISLLIINSILVSLAYPFLFKHIEFNTWLWVLIQVLTFLRILYVFPSLCLGVFGNQESLKMSAIYSLIFALSYIGIFALLMLTEKPILMYLIVILMIFHWLSKLIISNYFVYKSLKEHEVLGR